MKRITFLTAALFLAGLAQALPAYDNTPNAYESVEMGKSKSKSRNDSREKAKDRLNSKDRGNSKSNSNSKSKSRGNSRDNNRGNSRDRNNSYDNQDNTDNSSNNSNNNNRNNSNSKNKNNSSQNTRSNDTSRVAQGPKGDKGEKGDPGKSASLVYGYYYQMGPLTVGPQMAIGYENITKVAGGIVADTTKTAFVVPEKGDYEIAFSIKLTGDSVAAFGVELNNMTILPGSTFTSSELVNGMEYAQIHGHIIAPLAKGDSISIINVTDNMFALGEYVSPPSHNASLLIKKLD